MKDRDLHWFVTKELSRSKGIPYEKFDVNKKTRSFHRVWILPSEMKAFYSAILQNRTEAGMYEKYCLGDFSAPLQGYQKPDNFHNTIFGNTLPFGELVKYYKSSSRGELFRNLFSKDGRTVVKKLQVLDLGNSRTSPAFQEIQKAYSKLIIGKDKRVTIADVYHKVLRNEKYIPFLDLAAIFLVSKLLSQTSWK